MHLTLFYCWKSNKQQNILIFNANAVTTLPIPLLNLVGLLSEKLPVRYIQYLNDLIRKVPKSNSLSLFGASDAAELADLIWRSSIISVMT